MNGITLNIDSTVRQVITPGMANKYRIIPSESDKEFISFFTDRIDEIGEDLPELEVLLGKSIRINPVDTDTLDTWLSSHYPRESSNGKQQDPYHPEFLDELIKETISLKGSDIHVEPYEANARIRIRVNGQLVERYVIRKDRYPELINKIKIKSRLDIAEKRLPQDGRIKVNTSEAQYDIRVSILPTHFGEKAVLRILGQDASHLSINDLGFTEKENELFTSAISKPNGMVLISGPTGSGKTTTLYATLKELNTEGVNIITIEDPVEYTLKGINQVQLNEKVGLDFASAMRTFLRQDPDIIMVGEIRDVPTAKMATRAALTGHLVFSTIHTNSAIGIFSRLIEMGIDSYLLPEILNAGVAQRLVRILCDNCKKRADLKQIPSSLISEGREYYEPVGCPQCLGTGFSKRKAIYEIIPGGAEVTEFIGRGQIELLQYLHEKGIHTLKDNALELFHKGKTSFSEVFPYLI